MTIKKNAGVQLAFPSLCVYNDFFPGIILPYYKDSVYVGVSGRNLKT